MGRGQEEWDALLTALEGWRPPACWAVYHVAYIPELEALSVSSGAADDYSVVHKEVRDHPCELASGHEGDHQTTVEGKQETWV